MHTGNTRLSVRIPGNDKISVCRKTSVNWSVRRPGCDAHYSRANFGYKLLECIMIGVSLYDYPRWTKNSDNFPLNFSHHLIDVGLENTLDQNEDILEY